MRTSMNPRGRVVRVGAGIGAALIAVSAMAPGAAHAAPDGPVGAALIRVDGGGTARAVSTGESTYRVVLPRGADISWLGETRSRTVAIGTFTPGRLVERWRTLGHRRPAGVLATLTWRGADGRDVAALVTVSDPQRKSNGKLAFTIESRSVLPRELRRYSVNVRRATPQVRAYPVQGQPFNITSTVYMVAQADGPNAASGRIYSGDTTCYAYSHSVTNNQLLNFSTTCGSVKFADRSHVTITEQTNATPAAETANLKLVIDSKVMSFNQVLVQWDTLSMG